MNTLSGMHILEVGRGAPFVTLRASIGPYDREDPSNAGYTLAYRDLGDFTNADLTDRLVGIGTIRNSISLFLDPSDAGDLVITVDNSDSALSVLGGGVPAWGIPRPWLRDNRFIGRVLRIQAGIRSRHGAFYFAPLYEGLLQYGDQSDGLLQLKGLGLLKLFDDLDITGSPTYNDQTSAEIIEDLFDNQSSEADDFGRPRIDRYSFDVIGPEAPFLLDVTGAGSSVLSGLGVHEAMNLVAKHNFATVFVDGARRLRYVTREYTALDPDFRVDYDRNLIEGSLTHDKTKIQNSITVKWGASLTTAGPYESQESIDRYGEQAAEYELPFLRSAGDAAKWGSRALAEFAFPIPTYRATIDASGSGLEPGDWIEVFDPIEGLYGTRFQTFATDYNPVDATMGIECHNTDLATNESRILIVGISRTDSGDEFQ